MAKKPIDKKPELEREYIIPLRKEWRKVANYRRTGRAIKEIKKFIAKHMKVPERDTTKVKIDIYLNQEIWFRGKKKPPAKIKVKAKKEGDIVKVELIDVPQHVRFLRVKREHDHKLAEVPKTEKPKEEKTEPKEGEKTEQEKKEEKEKSLAVAETKAIDAKTKAKQQQKSAQSKQIPIHRKALKK